ncbi:hypothetical protein TanjilG_17949 [Lupinus angustifolius]|uniref:Armadillo repeat-containing domain-containing protein n=1 Tax=Lupinus angustifolius TaxID=3871 RepID=A0A1J7FX51_LUPAN|nr:hypothetical protein TanjilG_17949 [Lupinus angustifolius]
MQCGRVDLKSALYDTTQLKRSPSWLDKDCSQFGPPLFQSESGSRVPLSSILPQVQVEAVLWGLGTAIGELPPYFISRAARLSGREVDAMEELDSDDRGIMAAQLNQIKRWFLSHAQYLNFLTILVLASTVFIISVCNNQLLDWIENEFIRVLSHVPGLSSALPGVIANLHAMKDKYLKAPHPVSPNVKVSILSDSFSSNDSHRAAAKRATHVLADLAKNEEVVNVIVEGGAIPALVMHLQAPPLDPNDSFHNPLPFEHEVEKGSAFALGLLAVKPEHQQFIVDNGALKHLVNLLKRHNSGLTSRAVNSLIRRAADAITNLAHENSSIKTRVRMEGGIPPLVDLLQVADTKVQRAAAGALRTLAFKNDENKNEIVECNALPTLILMLRSEDAAVHYEAVGVIGNLVHSSPNIKKEVLLAGALQPVIGLLSSCCSESQREAALLLGQFAATDSDCKVSIHFTVLTIPL